MNIVNSVHHSIQRGSEIIQINDMDPSQEYEDQLILECILKELLHYCKHAGTDFNEALRIATKNFSNERKEYERVRKVPE